LIVTNLPECEIKWSSLKEHFTNAGFEVVFADIKDKQGVIELNTKEDAENAVSKLNDSVLKVMKKDVQLGESTISVRIRLSSEYVPSATDAKSEAKDGSAGSSAEDDDSSSARRDRSRSRDRADADAEDSSK